MSELTDLPDLASEALFAAVVAANDEFFAPKESLIKPEPAVFDPDRYTERGKWMDGWETRRRREPGHDWAIVRLGVPGLVRHVVVDTAHFKGNHPAACSIEGAAFDGYPSAAELAASSRWVEILPQSPLKGDSPNPFTIEAPWRFTHLRLHIYPDGGVARLRVHGEPIVHFGRLSQDPRALIDLAAAEHGGRVIACSDMFFGPRHNLIMPGRSLYMGGGWETRRRRGPGNDWVVVRLAARGVIRRVEIDTEHFKGNAPDACRLEGCAASGDEVPSDALEWTPILERTRLQPHTRHLFIDEVLPHEAITHVRLHVFPDGGVARLRLFGSISPEELVAQGVRWLDTLPPVQARDKLLACCGSSRWADAVVAKRPFGSFRALARAADDAWWALDRDDWLEAFSAHPRIGERKSAAGMSARWSEDEQSGVQRTGADVIRALAEGNIEYEKRFGFVFLIRAAGRSAEEMLAALRARLGHEVDEELQVAAKEQAEITRLRLEKMLEA